MKFFSVHLVLVVFFLTACGNQEEKDVQAYLEDVSRLSLEQKENTAAIAEILDKGLAVYPGSLPLLQSRANLYCSRGELRECRSDTRRLLEVQPGLVEAHTMICMLDEFEGSAREVYEPCYLKIVDMLAARPRASSPEMEISDNSQYVFALLMARHPDADKERAAFLSRVASDPQAWIYNKMFNDFDRTRALREVFGQ